MEKFSIGIYYFNLVSCFKLDDLPVFIVTIPDACKILFVPIDYSSITLNNNIHGKRNK